MPLKLVPLPTPEADKKIAEVLEKASQNIDNVVAIGVCYVERDGSSTVLYYAASDIVTLVGASALLTQRLVTSKED